MMRTIALAILVARIALGQGAPPPPRPDSLVLKDTVVAAERRFFIAWDSLWRDGQQFNGSFTYFGDVAGMMNPRTHNLHCHPDFPGTQTAFAEGRLQRSEHTWFSVCPSWDLGDTPTRSNERLSLDTALTPEGRTLVRTLRAALIATFDSAARLHPHDDFYAGQRVRFLVDQHSFDGALRVAHECSGTRWWCSALLAYVQAARGEVVASESAFRAAFAGMPDDERCRWTDYRAVIAPDARKQYTSVPCNKRDAVNDRLWWLADPLLIEPGNERRMEQNARAILLALRATPDLDERYSWDPSIGNDARREMVLRYGWPSYIAWGGPGNDSGHTSYLASHGAPRNPPYTTYEYTGARTHLIPQWDAIADPTRAAPSDWNMSPPDPREHPAPPPKPVAAPVTGLYAPHVLTEADTVPKFWWPVEHFEPHVPLAQLPDGQQALLRRKDGALLAVATDLGALRLGRRGGDSIPGITLVTSDAPESIQRIGAATGVVGTPFEIDGLISSRPGIAGIEFLPAGPRAAVAGRLRFGITPPAPLSALRAGETAISDPVILRAPGSGAALPNDPKAALRFMATSRALSKDNRLGVYWETYGFAATDSVEVAVWIERYTSQGIARRFGIVLRIATDLNTPVSVSWSEPQPGHSSHAFMEGRTPVVARAVLVDISSLAPGDYRLEVAVRKPRQEPVRGRTTFVVQ